MAIPCCYAVSKTGADFRTFVPRVPQMEWMAGALMQSRLFPPILANFPKRSGVLKILESPAFLSWINTRLLTHLSRAEVQESHSH